MVAMHEERLYVTERQKQQLKRTTGSLRQLNRTVLRELTRIGGRTRLTSDTETRVSYSRRQRHR